MEAKGRAVQTARPFLCPDGGPRRRPAQQMVNRGSRGFADQPFMAA